MKRDRLAQAGIEVPPNVTYVAVDFETADLSGALSHGGVDLSRPAVVSWLGVSMYLTEPAVVAVFEAVAALPAATELVFTFARLRSREGSLADRVTAVSEPWLSYFEPAQLRQSLIQAGFTRVEFLDTDDAAQYFAGRTDELVAPRGVSIASAIVE